MPKKIPVCDLCAFYLFLWSAIIGFGFVSVFVGPHHNAISYFVTQQPSTLLVYFEDFKRWHMKARRSNSCCFILPHWEFFPAPIPIDSLIIESYCREEFSVSSITSSMSFKPFQPLTSLSCHYIVCMSDTDTSELCFVCVTEHSPLDDIIVALIGVATLPRSIPHATLSTIEKESQAVFVSGVWNTLYELLSAGDR